MAGITDGEDEDVVSRAKNLKMGLAKANITKVAKKKGIEILKR